MELSTAVDTKSTQNRLKIDTNKNENFQSSCKSTQLHLSAAEILYLHGQVFQRLHESPRHVTRLGRLDGGVHQALAPTHGVEEELGRGEAGEEGVGDEACGWG